LVGKTLARIFAVLAVIAWLLLAANFVIGLAGGDFNASARTMHSAGERMRAALRAQRIARQETSPEVEATRREYAAADEQFQGPRFWMTLHLLLGSAASLMAILVSSITVTYFIGTSRWCKEVCDTYKIEGALAQRAAKIKRSAFPWALAGVLTIIAIVGLGAAADPSGANFERSASLVLPHYIAAIAGLIIVAVCFWMQTQRIAENYLTIEEILAEVKRIRGETPSEK
jgi:hypothetical protein